MSSLVLFMLMDYNTQEGAMQQSGRTNLPPAKTKERPEPKVSLAENAECAENVKTKKRMYGRPETQSRVMTVVPDIVVPLAPINPAATTVRQACRHSVKYTTRPKAARPT